MRKKHSFKPVSIDKFLIIPEGEHENNVGQHEKNVVLASEMAFGTGDDETTRHVLEYMVSICHGEIPESMLDIGCGSGILSIMGKLFGIQNVVAFDICPNAVSVAQKNISKNKNGLNGKIKLFAGEIEALNGTYHLITANIVSDVLKKLREEIRNRLAFGGKLILSGILDEEEYHIRRLYGSHPLMRFVERREAGRWVTLVFEKIKPIRKHYCPKCEFCQFCSDSRCEVCRV